MISISDFINESMILEAAPKFENSKEGIESFCQYVFNPAFTEYVINSDLSITIKPKNDRDKWCTINSHDLKELPSFIKFSNMETVGFTLDMDAKLVKFEPNVIGTCYGISMDHNSKLQEINLNNCECTGVIDITQNKGLKSIIRTKPAGPCQMWIRKNVNLEKLDLSGMRDVSNHSYIDKNKKLKLQLNKLPQNETYMHIEQ